MRGKLHPRAILSLLFAALLAAAPARPQAAQSLANSGAAARIPPNSGPSREAPLASKPDAKRARQAFESGQAAERKGDLPAALVAYDDAVRFAPTKPDYRIRLEAVRFALIQQHTERAERDAVAGLAAAARKELQAAVALDPGYGPAQERLQQLERRTLKETRTIPAFVTEPPALAVPPGTRTVDYRGDVRGAYTEIARQFGLSAVFDEDTQTRSIRFRVGEVDFATAMRLLAQQTKTFWRAIDAHTFLVANDTPEKRKEYVPVIERTIILPESERPEQMNEILRLAREFTGLTHAQLETATRTLTLRGPQSDVALAAELVRELEQARGEIMLEMEILEVERNAAQRLGITPPSSSKVVALNKQQLQQAQQSAQGLVQVLQQLFGTPSQFANSTPAQIASLLGTGGVNLSALVPPLIAFGGGRTVFLATLPGAAADFADTLSAVRSARRVLLRADDGEPATFFVGDRFPISLAVLSTSGAAGGGATPNVTVENFTTGAGPASVVAAAFRTGGHIDLATANAGQGANSVSILLGNGDGTFATNTDITVGTMPIALVAAAFGNHDAMNNPLMDLAVVNEGSNSVSILLGKGDGTFVKSTPDITVGTKPSAIVVGDFNKDGHPDLAVANQGSNSVSIILGNGDGTFQTPTTIPLTSGTGPVSIATADFDKDTNPDLVTANSTSDNVTVLFGDGHGAFPTQVNIATGTGSKPLAVAAADLNKDNNPDLIVANSGTDTISILLGNGTRANTFQTPSNIALNTGSQPSAVITGDFNGDGNLDLAVADTGTSSATILFGNGDGTFTNRVDFPTGSQPSALAEADFNGDNRLDLAIADANGSSVTVILNSNGVNFGQSPQLPYPSVEFEDIGMKVKATPRIHPENDVTLHMEIEVRSISASSFNKIPVISNRSVDETLRLKMNEPSILAGIFNLNTTNAVTGLPGAATAPGIGYAAGLHNPQEQETELIIVITPRVLRPAPRLGRARYLGPGGEPAGGAPAPAAPEPGEPPPP
jgi:Flp pilus assembly secretin CpaC